MTTKNPNVDQYREKDHNVHIRVSAQDKAEFQAFANHYSLSIGSALRMFIRDAIREKKIEVKPLGSYPTRKRRKTASAAEITNDRMHYGD